MEGGSKVLIIRSPRMGGLKYMVINLEGVIVLVIPEETDRVRSGLSKGEIKALVQAEAEEIGLDKMLAVVEKAGRTRGERPKRGSGSCGGN